MPSWMKGNAMRFLILWGPSEHKPITDHESHPPQHRSSMKGTLVGHGSPRTLQIQTTRFCMHLELSG